MASKAKPTGTGRRTVYLVEEFRKKTLKSGQEFLEGVGIVDSNQVIMAIYVNEIDKWDSKDIEAFLELSYGSFFGLKGASIDDMKKKISVGVNCRFYPIAKEFDVNRDVICSFKNPPLVNMTEVKRSPVKRRVSVKGVIVKVGEVKRYKDTQVRRINLHDEEGGLIQLSMWDKCVDLDIEKDSKLVFRHVAVGKSDFVASVESTLSMGVEYVGEDKTLFGSVICVGSSGLVLPYQIVIETDEEEEVELVVDQNSEVMDVDVRSLPSGVGVDIEVQNGKHRVKKIYFKKD